jgi:phage tail-like protein
MANASEERRNPYAAFNFVVKDDKGVEIAGFMEVSGLDGENAVIEYREGHDESAPSGTGGAGGTGSQTGAYVRKQPGLERYPNVVLRRGITGSSVLWDLRKAIRNATSGPELAKSGQNAPATPVYTVELQDETHKTVQTWCLQNPWVAKLTGPTLNAKSNEIAVEAVEVVCERIEIK